MADLSSNIRLAVDSGKVTFGARQVIGTIRSNEAKLIIISVKGKKTHNEDIEHMAKISAIKVIEFEGDPMELGAVCGKPFSVSALAIVDPGNSSILEASG
ncbi:MAG: 50S ribosomal protein L30e [Candidatus Micrarchaeaceae archaeon]